MKNFTHKLLLSLLFLCGSMVQSFAQDITVSGTVTDGVEGLPGVAVQVKGSSTGAVTDMNGKYSVSVGSDAILVFSFIGYATQEVAVAGRSSIDVTLSEDAQQLAEVVVIGYGETTIRDATGAVASVTAKDFNAGIISSPEQLIQGKTAGVQITSTSGAPGAGVELRIRGTNSVRSNNNPLFVVDGVPLAGDETTTATPNVGFGTTGASNPLNFLNPSDIESISILKDASSAAIYGSRGANGVVFITTKRGNGPGAVEFASSMSIASPSAKYDLLGREDFLSAVTQFGGDATAQDFGEDTDWQDYITRTSVSHKQNVSYSKGFQSGSVRASVGYEDQQGVIEESGLQRITGRLNGNYKLLDDALDLSTQLTLSRVDLQSAPVGGSAGFQGDLLGAAYSANPTWPTDRDFDSGGQRSPANMLHNFRSTAFTNRTLLNLSAEYTIIDGLKAKVTYGLDRSTAETIALATPEARNFDRGVFGNGRGGFGSIDVANNLIEATLNYSTSFGNAKLEVLGGYSYQDFGRSGLTSEAFGFSSSEFGAMESEYMSSLDAVSAAAASASSGFIQQFGSGSEISAGEGNPETGGFANVLLPTSSLAFFSAPSGMTLGAVTGNRFDTKDILQSYFGRANLNISEKYLLTATLRADGSSRFGDDEKVGIFPSFSVAWKAHEESFMPDAFSQLKVRGGWGKVGNQDGLGYGGFVNRQRYADVSINDGGVINVPGLTTVSLVNNSLKWEETSQINAGIDFGFLNGRLYGSFDVYKKETTDILLRLNAAQPAPNPFIFTNFDAVVVNQGWELVLGFDAVDTDDLYIGINGNISVNENEIQDFAGQIPAGTIRGQGLSQAFSQILAQGQPLFSYFVREFEGFDADGQPIGDNQGFSGKSALPTTNMGISLNARYKNFDFSAYATGQYGHYIYNNTQNAFFTAGAINNSRNVTPDVLTSGEAGSAEAAVSTRFLESGDFFRMQNMSLGYRVPLSEGGFISNLRIYANAQNLFLITDYSGLDPEVSSQPANADLLNELPTAGIDYTSYPRPRVFTLGLNVTF